MDHFLNINDYLTSNNGLFRVWMQNDGNFVVNLVTPTGEEPIWASHVALGIGNGPYEAIMQDDGNFVVYQTTLAGRKPIWATNTGWDLSKVELSNVIFDLDRATRTTPAVQSEVTRYLVNDTSVQQEDTFSFECDYTETISWSSTFSIQAGVETQIKANIPILTEGKVKVSVGTTYSYTWGEQKSITKKYSESLPVKVPAHSRVTCKASASTAYVSIPYIADATYYLTNGKQLRGKLQGEYQGVIAYQLQATWAEG
jgi:hypothetical protein